MLVHAYGLRQLVSGCQIALGWYRCSTCKMQLATGPGELNQPFIDRHEPKPCPVRGQPLRAPRRKGPCTMRLLCLTELLLLLLAGMPQEFSPVPREYRLKKCKIVHIIALCIDALQGAGACRSLRNCHASFEITTLSWRGTPLAAKILVQHDVRMKELK